MMGDGKQNQGLVIALIVGVLVALFVTRDGDKPGPGPGPSGDDAAVLSVIQAYADGCGRSLVDTDCSGDERSCNEALSAARQAARLQAHRPEDELLATAAGDPAKIKALGEAWLRLSAKLEKVR